jgi:hypothetical protein
MISRQRRFKIRSEKRYSNLPWALKLATQATAVPFGQLIPWPLRSTAVLAHCTSHPLDTQLSLPSCIHLVHAFLLHHADSSRCPAFANGQCRESHSKALTRRCGRSSMATPTLSRRLSRMKMDQFLKRMSVTPQSLQALCAETAATNEVLCGWRTILLFRAY